VSFFSALKNIFKKENKPVRTYVAREWIDSFEAKQRIFPDADFPPELSSTHFLFDMVALWGNKKIRVWIENDSIDLENDAVFFEMACFYLSFLRRWMNESNIRGNYLVTFYAERLLAIMTLAFQFTPQDIEPVFQNRMVVYGDSLDTEDIGDSIATLSLYVVYASLYGTIFNDKCSIVQLTNREYAPHRVYLMPQIEQWLDIVSEKGIEYLRESYFNI